MDGSGRGLAHHVVLYQCDDTAVPIYETIRCGTEYKWTEMSCRMFMGSPSNDPFSLPSEIYYPLKAGIYLLEVHFDLSLVRNLDVGYFDVSGSGLRTYYTSEMRKFAIASLGVGLSDFSIPPKTERYEISGALYSGCTEHYFPEDGIDLLYILGHAHYLGREIRLDKISENGVVQTLYETKHYDFDRQLSGHLMDSSLLKTFELVSVNQDFFHDLHFHLLFTKGFTTKVITSCIQEILCESTVFMTVRRKANGPIMERGRMMKCASSGLVTFKKSRAWPCHSMWRQWVTILC